MDRPTIDSLTIYFETTLRRPINEQEQGLIEWMVEQDKTNAVCMNVVYNKMDKRIR